jgi:endonuclease-3
MVTKTLFKKYKTPKDYLTAPIEELEKDIRSTGFFRNKTKSIKGCCQGLLNLYGGKVPSTMEELLKLPGVGRKTANCVLGAAFDIPGVVVDTHVKRLAIRLGFTENKDPDKIEKDVEKLFPIERWRRFSDILIYHGREVCRAKNPYHTRCQVFDLCPSNDKITS